MMPSLVSSLIVGSSSSSSFFVIVSFSSSSMGALLVSPFTIVRVSDSSACFGIFASISVLDNSISSALVTEKNKPEKDLIYRTLQENYKFFASETVPEKCIFIGGETGHAVHHFN